MTGQPALSAVLVSSGPTYTHTFRVDDPAGDNTSPMDVRRMVFNFNPTTGAYQIIISAPTAPFVGGFRVNVNLLNDTRGTFFFDNLRDFGYVSPVPFLQLTGTNTALSTWAIGDNVLTNKFVGVGFPNFWSAVSMLPCACSVSEDRIAFADANLPARIELLSAGSALSQLADLVMDLGAAGELDAGQVEALLAKVDGVRAKVGSGNTNAAANQLNAFLNQLSALARNSVGVAEAEILRSVALQLQGHLGS